MITLTLRLPDDKNQRFRALAKSRGTTVNRLMDEMTTLMLAEFMRKRIFACGLRVVKIKWSEAWCC